MELDPRERFAPTVEDYRAARPDYPEALIAAILAVSPRTPADVVDLGSGTGISSRALARAGARVIGVEPNAAMRAGAEADASPGDGVQYRAGEAAATGLPAASADLVVAGQAFHWFALDAVLPEIARVLRPDGAGVAFWNVRAEAPVIEAYAAALRRYSTQFDATPKPQGAIARLQARREVQTFPVADLPHFQVLDRAGLHRRAWSSSYTRHGVADRAGLDAALDALFDRFAMGGVLTFPYRAVAVGFRPRR